MRWNWEYIRWKIKNLREGRWIGGSIGTKKNPKTFVASPYVINAHRGRWPLEKDKLYHYKGCEITEAAKSMADSLDVELIPVEK